VSQSEVTSGEPLIFEIEYKLCAEPTFRENMRMSRANMDKNPEEVAAMFDGVAKRYDLVNDLLSLGRTKAWRKQTTKIIAPRPGQKILDLAAGTGSSSEPLAAAGADVIPADFSEGMLAAGRKHGPTLPSPRPMPSICPLPIANLIPRPSPLAFAIPRTLKKPFQRCFGLLSPGDTSLLLSSQALPGVPFVPFTPITS